MKQVLIKKGEAVLEEVSAPMVEDNTVLVQAAYSCISAGTEAATVTGSAEPLWKRAVKKPAKIKNVWNLVQDKGVSTAIDTIKARANSLNRIGYSCSGMVVETGKNVSTVTVGDRVACAGGSAYHAEIVNVPTNLIVKVPGSVTLDLAATTTLGSIAMQGLRRAKPTLGETFIVIGLGFLGQVTAQLLCANGCGVIGVDLNEERVELAKSFGMERGIRSLDDTAIQEVLQSTGGFGADGVIITAATSSDAVVSAAFRMCRKKGRVVLVGDVGLTLKRSEFYAKEIDFLISASYGPGRYDPNYEEKGLDYPIGYVRWTENRNMQAYLRLIETGKITIKPLINAEYDINKADKAYASLMGTAKKPVMILLSYPVEQVKGAEPVNNPSYVGTAKKGKIGISIAGAGAFAKGMHLPNLKKLLDCYSIQAIQSRSGVNAKETALQFGAKCSTTKFQDILDDKETAAILISTRHHLHAELALQALEAGKHVLVEKPLALNNSDLQRIVKFYKGKREGDALPILMTGFNRRFSVYARKIKEMLKDRLNPMIINYRMNAGYISMDHWVHTEEGGGRNLGEACHIYDLFTFFTGAVVKEIQARSIDPRTSYYGNNDNFVTLITFDDGSMGTLTYTALGDQAYPKERMEIYCDGKVIALDDYKSLMATGPVAPLLQSKTSDKGQKEELEAFANAILQGGNWPIPLWQQVQATEISLQVEEMIKKG